MPEVQTESWTLDLLPPHLHSNPPPHHFNLASFHLNLGLVRGKVPPFHLNLSLVHFNFGLVLLNLPSDCSIVPLLHLNLPLVHLNYQTQMQPVFLSSFWVCGQVIGHCFMYGYTLFLVGLPYRSVEFFCFIGFYFWAGLVNKP